MSWYLLPSGQPWYATDNSSIARQLVATGATVLADADVTAAVTAWDNRSTGPAGTAADFVTAATGREKLALADYSELAPWWARLAARDGRSCNIVMMGASITEGYPGPVDLTQAAALARILRARFPTKGLTGGGRGFVGVPTATMVGVSPWAFTGGTLLDPTAGYHWGPRDQAWFSTSAAEKAVLTVAGPLTAFDIYTTKSSFGSATGGYYKIDGGAKVNFSTFDASSDQIHQVTRVNAGVTSTIEVGMNSGGLVLTGIREYAGDDAKGIQVHNCGHGGWSAAQWLQVGNSAPANWRSAIPSLTPDLIVISDIGVNDAGTTYARTAAQFKTDLTGLLGAIRAAGMTCPIVLAACYTVVAPFTEPWANYVAVMRQVAAADPTVVLVDHSTRMPTAGGPSATYGLYYADGVHCSADGAGHAFMAATVAAAISPR